MTSPLLAEDFWGDFEKLFRGSDKEAYLEGTARLDCLRANASIFTYTCDSDLDDLRRMMLAEALNIVESIVVLNQFVLTERQRLKSIILIMNSLCEKYKNTLEKSMTPGYSIFERLTRIEESIIAGHSLVVECHAKQEKQLNWLIDNAKGIKDDPEDLSIPKSSKPSNEPTDQSHQNGP